MLIILLSFICTLTQACETKGVGIPLYLNVQPGATWTETFDFTDCQVGLRNSHFYLNFKGNCVSAELLDITTGVSYGTGVETRSGIVFYCVNNCESLKGHVLQLVIHNDARKVVNVEVQRSVCYCGP
jgi:hypothetical protein